MLTRIFHFAAIIIVLQYTLSRPNMIKNLPALMFLFYTDFSFATRSHSFYQSKKIVYKLLAKHPRPLYCHCTFNDRHHVELRSCHMDAATNIKRANITEIEHILPAELFGHQLACWQNQICAHCRKTVGVVKCCEYQGRVE
jgi:deoxyribonuclease-1